MFALMKSRTGLKMGQVGSKTRSQGQIIKKPCVRPTGLIFGPMFIKLAQNVCLNEILDKFEFGSFEAKKYVTRSSLRKTLCKL